MKKFVRGTTSASTRGSSTWNQVPVLRTCPQACQSQTTKLANLSRCTLPIQLCESDICCRYSLTFFRCHYVHWKHTDTLPCSTPQTLTLQVRYDLLRSVAVSTMATPSSNQNGSQLRRKPPSPTCRPFTNMRAARRVMCQSLHRVQIICSPLQVMHLALHLANRVSSTTV